MFTTHSKTIFEQRGNELNWRKSKLLTPNHQFIRCKNFWKVVHNLFTAFVCMFWMFPRKNSKQVHIQVNMYNFLPIFVQIHDKIFSLYCEQGIYYANFLHLQTEYWFRIEECEFISTDVYLIFEIHRVQNTPPCGFLREQIF